MAANWNNSGGGNWSVAGNWSSSILPGTNDIVTFVSGTYTSVIDLAFQTTTLNALILQPHVTLDIQRSITVTSIVGSSSTDGTTTKDGLVEIGNGAVLTYEAGGSFVNTILYLKNDGTGATGGLVVNGLIDLGGTLTLDGVNLSASGIVDSSSSVTLKNGAVYTAHASESYNGGTLFLDHGVANLGALTAAGSMTNFGLAADQRAVMSGTNNELILPNTADGRGLTISGFGLTDKIEIAGITTVQSVTHDASNHLNFFAGANGTGALLATLTNVSLAAGLPTTLDASHFGIGADATGTFIQLVSCFTPGTRVLTAKGEVAVENLREGDLVMTLTGGRMEPEPVIWIGHRDLDLTRHPYPWMAAPVRVRKGAFTNNVPHRDLVLSPDHAIFIDGGLVPVKLLINGATIVQEMPRAVEYYHVECAAHAIILAENLLVETYLDTGNRAMFDNAGVAMLLHPEFALRSAAETAMIERAPLTTEASVVEPIWRDLMDRARSLGHDTAASPVTTSDAAPRLLAGGRMLRPVSATEERCVFVLPRGVTEITLTSRTVRPALERPWYDDQRRIGMAIREIILTGDTEYRVLSADAPCLRDGWWPPEQEDGALWRWTDGAGVIPLPFAVRTIEIVIAMTTRYPLELDATPGRKAA